ncbi:MAG: 2-isopropylmalate synthase [Chloroflexota bacterium]
MTGPGPEVVEIYDTTLRDGEQAPGISLNTAEKLEIADQLARLGVDVIEAGYPIASPGDFDAVEAISRRLQGSTISVIARTCDEDVDIAGEALKDAGRSRILVFGSVSDIQIRHQLRSTREAVKESVRASIARAMERCDEVEYGMMDATRGEAEFLAELIQIALDEGAMGVTVADTVGYALPWEYGTLIAKLFKLVPDMGDVVVGAHCHDDLGLAVANSLAALAAGARRIHCTINGIGERAGNASLEESVMALHTRSEDMNLTTNVTTAELVPTSRLVARLTGFPVPPNKAIVGRNAFAHESGIHQDGVLKESTTYEIMDPVSVGLESNSIVLGKHSGRHAFRKVLEDMGIEAESEAIEIAFRRFKQAADDKKSITEEELVALISDSA